MESWMVTLMPSTIHWAYCPVRTTDQSNWYWNISLAAAGFVASGLPMILGDTTRHLEYKQEVAVALARASKARRKGMNDVGQTQTGERQRFALHQERH
jgi:hypothetical protein